MKTFFSIYSYIAVYKCLKRPWLGQESDILTSAQDKRLSRVTDLLQLLRDVRLEFDLWCDLFSSTK